MTDPKSPKKFVSLHSHSVLSVGDGLGFPQDHIDFAIKNGLDAHALTDHGNVSGFGFQQNKLKDLKKAGIKFKGLTGEEFYYIDSLTEWKKLYDPEYQAALPGTLILQPEGLKKTIEEEAIEELNKTVGNETIAEEDDVKGTVIELEAESKSFKWLDPKRQRNHLVIIAKNKQGLKSLFTMCSESYLNTSHGFPRIDLDMIRKYGKGNLIGISACITGDAIVCTSLGLLSLKDVVEKVSTENQPISILGYNEETKQFEYQKINNGQLTRKKAKIIKITLADGKILKCTPDHKVLTNLGWLRADELTNHKDVLVCTLDEQVQQTKVL